MHKESSEKGRPNTHPTGYSLVVAWNKDSAALGASVIDYLSVQLGCRKRCGIALDRFFSFDGVRVEGNVIQFPESGFYTCERNKLLMCISDLPHGEWYAFLNALIDMADKCGSVEEIYTIGGMVSVSAPLTPRKIFPVFNSVEMKERIGSYHAMEKIEYQTPPGQRPTLSSFLSWIAKRRNIPAVNLWVGIPFYLTTVRDAMACKAMLKFFDQKFNLGIDLRQIDDDISVQNEKIEHARNRSPEIDGYLTKLEASLGLSEEENVKLINEIEVILGETC